MAKSKAKKTKKADRPAGFQPDAESSTAASQAKSQTKKEKECQVTEAARWAAV
jgi:hypothetical protein